MTYKVLETKQRFYNKSFWVTAYYKYWILYSWFIFFLFLDATVLRNAIHVQYPGCQDGKGQWWVISTCHETRQTISMLLLWLYKHSLYTGWRLMIDQKYFLTETLFWALTTFYAYGGLTRGGPFDKIFFLAPSRSSRSDIEHTLQPWGLYKECL